MKKEDTVLTFQFIIPSELPGEYKRALAATFHEYTAKIDAARILILSGLKG